MVIEAFMYGGFEYVLDELTIDELGNETAVYARADGEKVVMNRSSQERALHELWFADDLGRTSIGEV